jgi:CheY-like chemotaxis protein
MTNEAMLSILDYLYSEALMATGTASADQLLRSIDDVRDLLSRTAAAPGTTEEFDIVRCVTGIIEILNLASGKQVERVVVDALPESLMVTQDRRAVEQMLTRVLDCALKLAEGKQASFVLRIADSDETRIKLALTMSEPDLAVRVAHWLNIDLNRVLFANPGDVPQGIALMVAGKRLRALGGESRLDGTAVALYVPSHTREAGLGDCGRQVLPDALNILVAEDNDESFVLTETVLHDQHVWRARDGHDALEMIQKQRFDMVFMDVHMPGMNGYDVIRSMRDWETRTGSVRTPLVVLSSDDVETQQRSAAEYGCSGFLKKPLQRWEVTPLLERLK